MRIAPLPVLALLALLIAGAATTTLGAPPGPPQTREYAWDVTAVPCAAGDGVCLAYDGQIPGPMLDVNLGDTVRITLVNRIAETVANATEDEALRARLSAAPVSFHVHGTSISAAMDGVAAHPGTQLVESVAAPGGSFTYEFRAAFAGAWHYHDHVLGADGSEGTARGLFGGLIVRSGAEPRPDVVLDLRVHDDGVNAGFGVQQDAVVRAGDDVDLLVAGLGNRIWTVTIEAPDGATVARLTMAPGLSERVVLRDVAAGAYVWRAQWGPYVHEGELVVISA